MGIVLEVWWYCISWQTPKNRSHGTTEHHQSSHCRQPHPHLLTEINWKAWTNNYTHVFVWGAIYFAESSTALLMTRRRKGPWASCQIRILRVAHAPGMPGTFFPPPISRKPQVSDPDMHHGTCVTHVPWRKSGSLTSGGGENIPGACATCNFTYLVRGPWQQQIWCCPSLPEIFRFQHQKINR